MIRTQLTTVFFVQLCLFQKICSFILCFPIFLLCFVFYLFRPFLFYIHLCLYSSPFFSPLKPFGITVCVQVLLRRAQDHCCSTLIYIVRSYRKRTKMYSIAFSHGHIEIYFTIYKYSGKLKYVLPFYYS